MVPDEVGVLVTHIRVRHVVVDRDLRRYTTPDRNDGTLLGYPVLLLNLRLNLRLNPIIRLRQRFLQPHIRPDKDAVPLRLQVRCPYHGRQVMTPTSKVKTRRQTATTPACLIWLDSTRRKNPTFLLQAPAHVELLRGVRTDFMTTPRDMHLEHVVTLPPINAHLPLLNRTVQLSLQVNLPMQPVTLRPVLDLLRQIALIARQHLHPPLRCT